MAGPVASVIVPLKFSDEDKAGIRFTLKEHPSFSFVGRSWDGWNDFWMGGQPFLIGFGIDEGDVEEYTEARVADFIGWTPADSVYFCAMCNGDADHLWLGGLCLLFAQRLRGLVDFNGALGPLLDDETKKLWEIGDFSLASWRPHFDRLFSGMPGTVYSIPRCGGDSAMHIGDATFLQAWLRHPHFRMVK